MFKTTKLCMFIVCSFLTTSVTSEKTKQNEEGCNPHVVANCDPGASCSKWGTVKLPGWSSPCGFQSHRRMLAVKIRTGKASIIQEVINEAKCKMYRQENGKHNFL